MLDIASQSRYGGIRDDKPLLRQTASNPIGEQGGRHSDSPVFAVP